ncbi:ABC transporter ATP-binding protein [Thioclava sp. GXIMD2076]|uniref:ABC transporter ATP-binding protein n=1 Tax=unclassified Thioclava TaxID=2621713 RepID=UPI0030D489D5
MGITVENLAISYERHRVLDGIDLTLPKGCVTAIIGPNGCGKSTLLRAIGGHLRPERGRVRIEGDDLVSLPPKALARRLGLLPQAPLAPEGLRVGELVARGRLPWLRPFRPLGPLDQAVIARAMEATDIVALRDRPVEALSGGQRQRVWIAMVLAQDTGWQLFDEPTTWLDLPHQLEVLKLVQALNRAEGRSVVMSLHDISLAARFADHIVALRAGKLVAEGPAAEVITPDTLKRVFDLEADVIPDPRHGTPLVLPY